MHRFLLPDIGEGLDEAEIVEWFVAVGDTVERDQPLVEVLTDKASSELPAPVAGTVVALGGEEGDTLTVGALLVEIDAGGPSDMVPAAPEELSTPAPASEVAPAPRSTARPKAAPATRRLAREMGIDLTSVAGTGPGGRILAGDLHPAGSPESPAPPTASGLGHMPPGRHPLRGIRGAVARNMARSWSEIPHIHSMDELDATHLLDLRDRMAAQGRTVGPLAVAIAAVARALVRYPMVNGHIDGDEIVIPDEIHIGVAVATDAGLVVPVLRHADRLDVFAVAAAVGDLAERARSRSLTLDDLSGATFTVTNYGSLGGRFATPIVPPGQAGILGLGRIAARAMVADGEVVARPALPMVVGADHRLLDGDLVEAFRRAVADDLAEPLRLLIDG